MPNEFIKRITGYSEKQIEKIRKEAKENKDKLSPKLLDNPNK